MKRLSFLVCAFAITTVLGGVTVFDQTDPMDDKRVSFVSFEAEDGEPGFLVLKCDGSNFLIAASCGEFLGGDESCVKVAYQKCGASTQWFGRRPGAVYEEDEICGKTYDHCSKGVFPIKYRFGTDQAISSEWSRKGDVTFTEDVRVFMFYAKDASKVTIQFNTDKNDLYTRAFDISELAGNLGKLHCLTAKKD